MTQQTPLGPTIDGLQAEVQDLQRQLRAAQERLASAELAYSYFVPKQFLHFLSVDDIRAVRLGMQAERRLSILFSDIRDFTSLSETMSPQENFDFLNSYLSQMEPEIVPLHGLIDKFIGDAIMALFPERADDAVQSALAMLDRLETYNLGRARAGYVPVRIGIGINTGLVMLGMIGGAGRMDGTVISDSVNLASRLEALTKVFNVPLLISEHTLYSLEHPDQFAVRFIARSQVKGKNESLSIYEVFDADPPALREAKLRTRKRFEEALAFYHTGDVPRAQVRLLRCLEEAPDDQPVQVYLARCDEYLRTNQAEGVNTVEMSQSWDENASSGIGDIDGKHRSLLAQINLLTAAIREQRLNDALVSLEAIAGDALQQFAVEQSLMQESHYPFAGDHQQQHACFNQHIATLKAEVASGTENEVYLGFRVKRLLNDWLINHSMKSDRHFGQYLQSRRGVDPY
ncbi:MAG: guanylate cyclase [Burkholderiales bacterium]|nr:guanylate cyclase [Burkholderiales bacterium]